MSKKEFKLEILGLKEITKILDDLPKKATDSVYRSVMREVVNKEIKPDIEANNPYPR